MCRLSTIQNADKIFVMNEGQLVEEGTHASLMDLGGLYSSLVSAQAREDEENDVIQDDLDDFPLSSLATTHETIKGSLRWKEMCRTVSGGNQLINHTVSMHNVC